ncbi:ribonuclease P protein subunit [Candidatus Woesearchaeota archaeon]|nr:ribonuclease P protein subunit [Candidatus Woesearchaeota archaeon]
MTTMHPRNQPTQSFRQPLIGREVSITQSRNSTLVGLDGTVIDETKNTFTIKTQSATKTIIKSAVTIDLDGTTIKPRSLLGRAEERIKK